MFTDDGLPPRMVQTIERAIKLLDETSEEEAAGYLAKTDLMDFHKRPAGLRKRLWDDLCQPNTFTLAYYGAYKAAQELLRAAGQDA